MKRISLLGFLVGCVLASGVLASDAQSLTKDPVNIVLEDRAPLSGVVLPATARIDVGRRFIFTALEGQLAGLQAYDMYSTLTALKRGCREANPVMGGLVAHAPAFIALKAGLSVASIYSAERMWRQHHRVRAIVMIALSNGLMTAVAVHNARVLRTVR
jgi:hypothetical protein